MSENKKKRETSSQLTPEKQLDLWVKGDSRCPSTANECCPDFSCCYPELQSPVEVREAFKAASRRDRAGFLGGFLGALIDMNSRKKAVRVVTGDPEPEN